MGWQKNNKLILAEMEKLRSTQLFPNHQNLWILYFNWRNSFIQFWSYFYSISCSTKIHMDTEPWCFVQTYHFLANNNGLAWAFLSSLSFTTYHYFLLRSNRICQFLMKVWDTWSKWAKLGKKTVGAVIWQQKSDVQSSLSKKLFSNPWCNRRKNDIFSSCVSCGGHIYTYSGKTEELGRPAQKCATFCLPELQHVHAG